MKVKFWWYKYGGFEKIKPWCLIYSWEPKVGKLSAQVEQVGDHFSKAPKGVTDLLVLGISDLVIMWNANMGFGMVIKPHVLRLKPDSNSSESLRWSNTEEQIIPHCVIMNLKTFHCNIWLIAETGYRTK